MARSAAGCRSGELSRTGGARSSTATAEHTRHSTEPGRRHTAAPRAPSVDRVLHGPRHARALEQERARSRLAELTAGRPWVPAVPPAARDARSSADVDRPGEGWFATDLLDDPGTRPGLAAQERATEVAEPPRGSLLGSLVARAADRIPPGLRSAVAGTALRPGHVAVLLVLAVLGVAAAALLVLAARPRAEPVPRSVGPIVTASSAAPSPVLSPVVSPPVSPVAAAGAQASPPSASGASAAPSVVVVDVAGKIHHPRVVTLPAGSRVVDALRAAGGARAGTDLTTLNLARVLVDGEQVAVGVRPAVPPTVPSADGAAATGSAGGAGTATGSVAVDLNAATLDQLEALPGVGPVLAQRILDWRTEHGRFSSVDELMEVSGIGEARMADLRPLVTV